MGALVKGPKLDLIPFKAEALGDNEVRARAGGAICVADVFDVIRVASRQVFVDVKYCGMCHSDLHKVCNDWDDFKAYPMVRVGVGVTNHTGDGAHLQVVCRFPGMRSSALSRLSEKTVR